jgi:hypothetical protein
MPRRPKAVALTGAQIDILLSLPEPALRDALKRLQLEPESAPQIQAHLIAAGVAVLNAREQELESTAAMTELLPMIKAAGIDLPPAVIEQALNRAAGVQADDGEA